VIAVILFPSLLLKAATKVECVEILVCVADVQKESSYRSPHSLGLKEAVRQIKESYEWAVGKQRPSPFFFVIGAGVSVPQVPLASEIIRYCKKNARPQRLT